MTRFGNLFLGAAVMLTAAGAFSGCGNKSQSGATGEGPYAGVELDKLTSNANRLAVIETSQGTIKLQLFDKLAPKHVAHFTELAKSHFYDGLTFHRVIPGFMIQGGDPNSRDEDLSNDGTGAPGQETVPAEFSKLHHYRGILSAARRGNDVNSATSQFFIMVKDNGSLDNQYSIYGQVVEGMDVVDKLVGLPRNSSDNPGKAALITSVTISE